MLHGLHVHEILRYASRLAMGKASIGGAGVVHLVLLGKGADEDEVGAAGGFPAATLHEFHGEIYVASYGPRQL